MTKHRLLLITAAAASIMAAAAPSASALDSSVPAGTITGAAGKAAGAAALRALPLAAGAVGDQLGRKVGDVQGTVTDGADAVGRVNDLVG
ncbi:hypothetical protein [Streptacidiphilus carbonis]|uniref:hypothetical protein n=1 Tax=Streptacidiphilus carbonis TaxID=105422 RepID=UPI0005A76541|nr:hypothetical protein [Streptacidiphilus carbonis]